MEQQQKFSTANESELLKIEAHLSNNAYLADGPLPGVEDSVVFLSLQAAPDASKYFNTFHWFATLSLFNKEVVKSW